MSELTKEYLDQALKSLATKEDLQKAVASLATGEQVEEVARMVAAGFEDMQNRLDVTAQLKTFERKFQRLEEALHIKL
jgi:hypothetical protein